MIMICLVFVICHLSFCPVGAQSYTQRVQQNTGMPGKVTIHQDAAIDNLVNGLMATQPPKQEKPAQRQQNTSQRQQNNAVQQRQQTHTPADADVPNKTLSKLMKSEN